MLTPRAISSSLYAAASAASKMGSMGLAISRTIIEAHGGSLWAEDRNTGGAAFRFTVPIAATADGE